MNYERLRAGDYRFLAVCLALLAGTLWYSINNFYRAFPEASIDFRVNRDEAGAIAARFLAGRGYGTTAYREASSFTYDDNAKTFLEREAGLEQANRIMGTRVRLWNWSFRWFRPQQKEEYRVDVTPRGELSGFAHEIPEDAARPAVDAARARSLAEDFLRSAMHRDPAALDFVEQSDTARPHRTDRVFTWKERDFDIHDATSRIEVTLLGGEIGGYREYLKVPEQWTRDYERLRSKNQVAQLIDTAVTLLLLVGLIVAIAMGVRGHDVRWRMAAAFGLVGMALSFLSFVNQFSLEEFQYPTTDSYASFVARQVLQGAISALGFGGLLFVLAAGAEPLYRRTFGGQVSLGNLFTLRALRTKRFFLGATLGITLTSIFVAYQTGFYILAYRQGAWSPADVPYTDLLNTRFPWLFVLIGGYLPALSEEFLFRMFAIPFLRKITRSFAVAVVAAGFIWGFGHAGYPQQPFYIRGLEVGIGGVALGLIMLRWGILPTLVWHYSVDAMYSALLLVRSHSLYYRLSGAISAGIVVLPVVLALVAYWRRGGFEPPAGLLNTDDTAGIEPPSEAPPEPAQAEPQASRGYRALGIRTRIAAVVVLAAGVLLLFVPAPRFGASPRYRITEEQARTASDGVMRAQGLDPTVFRHVTYPESHSSGPDALATKYFAERRSIPFAARMFENHRPAHFWATRYFKSLDQEEVSVAVHPETAAVLGFIHTVPEARPGADLPLDRAREIGAALARSQGFDVSRMELKESSSEKKKARRDYALEWEAPPGDPRNVDEAHYRVHVGVSGAQATDVHAYWKVPEAFERSRSRQNFYSIFALTMRIAAIAALVVCGLLLLIHGIRKGMVPWRVVVRIAVPAALLMSVGPLLALRLSLQNYGTAVPLETFQAMMYISLVVVAVLGFLMLAAAVAMIASFFPESLSVFRRENRRAWGIDAVAALAAAAGLALCIRAVAAALVNRFHGQALLSVDTPALIATSLPSLAALSGAVERVLLFAGAIAVLALVLRRVPTWAALALGVAAAFASVPGGVRTAGEFGLYFVLALAEVAAAALFCLVFARRNYLAYALVFFALALRGPLAELLGTPLAAVQTQGWIVVIVLGAVVVWAVIPALRRGVRSLPESPAP